MLGVGLTACLPAPAPPPEPVNQIDDSTQYGLGIHQMELHDWSRGIAPYGEFPAPTCGRSRPPSSTRCGNPALRLLPDHAPYLPAARTDGAVLTRLGVDWQFYTPLLERIRVGGLRVVAPTYPLRRDGRPADRHRRVGRALQPTRRS